MINIKILKKQISKTIEDKTHLIENLKKVREIAEFKDHTKVIKWINLEFKGYNSEEEIPKFREIKDFREVNTSFSFKLPKINRPLYAFEDVYHILEYCEKGYSHMIDNVRIEISKREYNSIVSAIITQIKTYLSIVDYDLEIINEEFNFIIDKEFPKFKSRLKEVDKIITIKSLKGIISNIKERDILLKNINFLISCE